MSALYRHGGKRAFDLVAGGLGLVVLSPVFVMLALVVRARLGSPVLFRQARPGLGGRSFVLLKFRSMSSAVNASGELLSDASRLGSFGRFLRSTSLDELPELWNVVRGDMSLVGPRPLLESYMPLYSASQARRHSVRPGLTGWAQVNGRNALSWPEKFELDVWYVDHMSFGLDMRILCKTAVGVVRRAGISAEGEATMPPFEG